MIRWFRKKKVGEPAYRQNSWKGSRGLIEIDRRQRRWARVRPTWNPKMRIAAWAAGLTMGVWAVIVGASHLAPIIEHGLEIREIQIQGVHHVAREEVLQRLALKNGTSLHRISLPFLAERLRTIAWIKEATLERLPLHTLRVTVVERQPAAIARVGSEFLLLDEEGVVLTRLGDQDQPSLPLVIGATQKILLQGESGLRRTVQASIELARTMAHTVEGRVEIDVSDPLNLVASAKGMRFQFGHDALLDQWNRFRMVKAVFKPGTLDGRKRELGEVDLRYDNRVIVRERG
ncbi:putative Cell division protein FtsQ [Nitrospira japonica]|uniref:Putative Cell division protein FtsQ n=1 Tax=Nitrospira japonica TaxID=1325564 RepID=A0A1W1I4U5_9BACT|nr:FtsQ-type POTRA domain-containing protein [Nitrospira japonica]SLM47909.1 putative Cell division protein FtsQ [Nitrospira japonica]